MAAAPIKKWGVTSPVSTVPPTEAEIAANLAMIDELKQQNNFESPEATEKRKTVLHSLQKITTEFVQRVSRLKKKPESIVTSSGGKIFTYGSYRLGAFGPGTFVLAIPTTCSDIDTLVVVPSHVSREDFFDHFPNLLLEMAPNAIEDLTPVRDAFVPIIKFEFSGISIDLIFASLNLSSVPLDLDLKNSDLLKGQDETGLRCLNGTRVTDEILTLVPQVGIFRNALRAIKLWAQRRAIYANVYGFPGGVAWAMLVARICQLYPRANSAVIVNKFFKILTTWQWPNPILLKAIEDGPLHARVWNPQIYAGDRYHLMPIITPAYPSMCSTHTITKSTMEIILREMARGGEIVNNIFAGKLLWKDLFQRHSFFTSGYKYYLSITSAGKTKDAQLIWSGLVESKVRQLVLGLENSGSIQIAHPYVKGFSRVHRCHEDAEIDQVLNGCLAFVAKDIQTETAEVANDARHNAVAQAGAENQIAMLEAGGDDNEKKQNASDVGHNIKAGDDKKESNGLEEHTVYTTTYYIGIELAPDNAKSLDISYETRDFKSRCTQWDSYNEDLMSVTVSYIRNYDLPDDVFEPGEGRPTRTKAKKMKSSKKRTFAEADPHDLPDTMKRHQVEANGLSSSNALA